MRDFIFENRTKIIFGRNTEKYVGPEAIKYGKKPYYIMVVARLKK